MDQILTTVTGKPVTLPASTRLELSDYKRVVKAAESRGMNMAAFIRLVLLREIGEPSKKEVQEKELQAV